MSYSVELVSYVVLLADMRATTSAKFHFVCKIYKCVPFERSDFSASVSVKKDRISV